jgi:hypothetical protein
MVIEIPIDMVILQAVTVTKHHGYHTWLERRRDDFVIKKYSALVAARVVNKGCQGQIAHFFVSPTDK